MAVAMTIIDDNPTSVRLVDMESVGAYEAKTKLAELLDRVGRGETITITKHGVPVASLTPIKSDPRSTAPDTVRELRQIRKGVNLGGLSVRDLIEEGRR